MLKIIGLLSVFLSAPVLGSDELSVGQVAPTEEENLAFGLGDVSLAESPNYAPDEALAIARELYGESRCSSCGSQNDAVLSDLLIRLPKATVDSFKVSALEIKEAVDPSHTCASHMIDHLSAILSLGALPAVNSAMVSFREISARCKPFLTCAAGHADVIAAFQAQIISLQALAESPPSE